MEASSPNVSANSDEERSLRALIDAFSSAFSCEEIASAYCMAGRNADLAGEFLNDMRRSASISTVTLSSSEARSEGSSGSLNCFRGETPIREYAKPRTDNSKTRSVSAGTVSGILGKDYLRSTDSMRPARMGSKVTKPFKINNNALPMTGIQYEEGNSNLSSDYSLHKEMEDFLFKMLGEGFQLDRDVIQQVLGNCGYNMQKSMEKLLNQSMEIRCKRKDFVGESTGKFSSLSQKSEAVSSESNRNGVLKTSGEESHGPHRRDALQKELLASLFNAPERHEELPRETMTDAKRSFPYCAVEPITDSVPENKSNQSKPRQENGHAPDEEDEYGALRKAVKEYRSTMKEYFAAAIDAFAKGDQARVSKLMEQGQFFQKKAREADEESAEKMCETRGKEPEEMVLDLQSLGRKEALNLLKFHISSLAGIPSIKYLKVIIDGNEDGLKGSRKRLPIMKHLEKESIEWKEGEDAGTILIRLDNIARKRLNFLKNQQTL